MWRALLSWLWDRSSWQAVWSLLRAILLHLLLEGELGWSGCAQLPQAALAPAVRATSVFR